MPVGMTRRDTLKTGVTASALALMADWALPVLADDEVDVPFTDLPKNFNPGANPNAPTRTLPLLFHRR